MTEDKKSQTISFQLILILLFIIFIAKFWYRFLFNLVFVGYNIFDEMRLGIVFACIIWRIVLYPLRLVGNYFSRQERKANEEHEKIMKLKDPVLRKEREKQWMSKNHFIISYLWFNFCFNIMNALMAGWLFLQDFTQERIANTLYPFISEPSFPLETAGWVPFVGHIDLTVINQPLNLISALGVAVVGLVDIVVNKKNSKRELIMLLLVFPAGAFFITSQVPSGFEFSMSVLEALTIVLIFIEGGVGRFFKSMKESDKLKEPNPYSLSQIKKPPASTG